MSDRRTSLPKFDRVLSFGVTEDGHASGRTTSHATVPGVVHQTSEDVLPDIETRNVKSLKLFAISDVHCEQTQNMQWLRDLEAPPCPEGHINILLAPGDIATGLKKLKEALEILKSKFQEVVFVPGNHELWSSDDSLLEMQRCADCCLQLGVRTKPFAIHLDGAPTVFVLPLQSWYHHSWDKEPDLPAENAQARAFLGPFATRWGDFSFCRWPVSLTRGADWKPMGRAVPMVARKMAMMNNPWLKAIAARKEEGDVVVTLSHFLPRMELLPEKRFLLEPNLTKVTGSDVLREQVVESGSCLHVFGHTHIPMDLELDGCRYVQWCLGSKHETTTCAKPREEGPLELWDSAEGMRPYRATHWTSYYREHPRDTSITELAPWVTAHLDSMRDKYGSRPGRAAAGGEKKRPPAMQETRWNSFSGSRTGGLLTPTAAQAAADAAGGPNQSTEGHVPSSPSRTTNALVSPLFARAAGARSGGLLRGAAAGAAGGDVPASRLPDASASVAAPRAPPTSEA